MNVEKQIELLKREQQELNRRKLIEDEACRLIGEGRHKEAQDLLRTIDNSILLEIEKEIDRLEAGSRSSGPSEEIPKEPMELQLKKTEEEYMLQLDGKRMHHLVSYRIQKDPLLSPCPILTLKLLVKWEDIEKIPFKRIDING